MGFRGVLESVKWCKNAVFRLENCNKMGIKSIKYSKIFENRGKYMDFGQFVAWKTGSKRMKNEYNIRKQSKIFENRWQNMVLWHFCTKFLMESYEIWYFLKAEEIIYQKNTILTSFGHMGGCKLSRNPRRIKLMRRGRKILEDLCETLLRVNNDYFRSFMATG